MVHDLVVAADLLVLLADGVHAVRATRDNQLRFHIVQSRNVLVRKLAVKILIPGATGTVARAALLLAKDSKVDLGMVEQFDERARGLLRLRIVQLAAQPTQ